MLQNNTDGITVLSLFDGMSCGQLALQKLGIKVKAYFASEIDKHAIQVTQRNFPDTIQLGDVRNVSAKDLPKIDLLLGGSPCQGFSFAGKQLAFYDPRSQLFFEYVRLKDECNPRYFLLENVRMAKQHEAIISRYMDIKPLVINSALVSAQHRVRLYWTNIANEIDGIFGESVCMIPQPKNKGILLKDILENDVPAKYYSSERYLSYLKLRQEAFAMPNIRPLHGKASCIMPGNEGKQGSDMNLIDTRRPHQLNTSTESNGRQPFQQNRVYDTNAVAPALQAQLSTGSYHIVENNDLVLSGTLRTYNDGKGFREVVSGKGATLAARAREDGSGQYVVALAGKIRRLTPVECERLQTVPGGYTACVSDTQRYKMLGNGWTVDVIAHILSYMN